jgi:uncharacterized protein (TIGR03067 family)
MTMPRNALALAVVMGVAVASAPADLPKEPPGEAKRELKALEGKWRAVKFIHSDRETVPGTDDDPFVITVTGGKIDFAGVATAAVADLDPTTDPKCLDFKAGMGSGVLKAGAVYESVYKRDGDTLTWAFYHGRGKSRPTSLDKPTDPALMVMVLTRVKE